MILVHHLNNSRSQRVLWLLEELGEPYEIAPHLRDPVTNLAPPALRALHPLGKLPVIVDGAVTLAESGAIIAYLLDRYGQGRLVPPSGTPAWVRYQYWLHYAEGSAMPQLLLKLVFDQIEAGWVPFFIRPVTRGLSRQVKAKFVLPEIARHLDMMEAELARGPWFAGEEMTAADIQMSFLVQAAEARAGLDASRPNLMAFLQAVQARPAWQRSVERGGPYRL